MPVDPNDLLIFKMRGMQFGAAAGKIPGVKPQVPVPMPEMAPEEEEAVGRAFAARATAEAGEAVAPEMATERPSVELGYLEEESRKLQGFIAGQEMEAERAEAAAAKRKGKKGRSAKEEMDAARGLTCVNHPWRPAYAVCDYCDRAWCFADLVSYNGKFYCLEDIDSVSREVGKEVTKTAQHNSFEVYAGVVFLINAVILAYFAYPQWTVLLGYVSKVGFLALLANLGSNYGAFFLDLVAVLLGIIGGIILLAKIGRSYQLGAGIGAVIIVLVTYEFFNSTATYLIADIALAFAAVGVLAFSRRVTASAEKTAFEEVRHSPGEVQWPQLETF